MKKIRKIRILDLCIRVYRAIIDAYKIRKNQIFCPVSKRERLEENDVENQGQIWYFLTPAKVMAG